MRQFWAKEILPNSADALEAVMAHVKSTGVKGVYFSNDIDGTSFNIGKMQVSVHGYISYGMRFGKPLPGKGSRDN